MTTKALIATGHSQRMHFDHLRPSQNVSIKATHEVNDELPDWASNAQGNAHLRVTIGKDTELHVRRRRWFKQTGGRHHYHEDDGEYRVQYVVSIMHKEKALTDQQNAVHFALYKLDAKTFRLDLKGISEEHSPLSRIKDPTDVVRSISFTTDGLVKIEQEA